MEAFLPAIAGIARGYDRGGGVERTELIQEGVAGLLFAVRRYDAGLGTPFWAYASFWVRKAMQELVAELTRPVALWTGPSGASRSSVPPAASTSKPTAPSPRSRSWVAQPASRRRRSRACWRPATPRGIEEPLRCDDEATGTLADTIADPVAEREYDDVLSGIEVEEVRVLADRLDDRERTVLSAHYGLGQSAQTLTQIGAALGLTAERARQIESAALAKLRAGLAGPALQALGSGCS